MVGTRIGPFVVKDKLGEGGMGAVYVAEHTVLDTTRVIKVLLPELTRNQTVVQRFINEARAAAAIQHRNIIAVHDVGQLPDGDWYIVMDHLPGGTLRALLADAGGPLAPELALELIAQIANGLDAAHARGVIHRDLKPDNILITPRDGNERHVVILDFGVAKLNEQLAGSLTVTGQAIGTPAFMPPEQLRGAKVDATCDVFALGVIAYQLITGGYLPYQDASVPEPGYASLPAAEIYHRQISGAAVDPRQRTGSVPDGWARVILGALEREPSARPASAGAFARALAEATPEGAAIVRAVAPELFEARRETRATVVASGHSAPSTLGAAAGQSMTRARSRAFWPVPVVCALVTSLVTLGVMRAGGEPIVMTRQDMDEAFLLAWFWDAVTNCRLVGFNILNFDLPVLIRRSQLLGVAHPVVNLDRYRTPHIDVMERLSFNGRLTYRSLNFYARRFGVELVETDLVVGADIPALVAAGEWDTIRNHCMCDIRKTTRLAARLGWFKTPVHSDAA